MLCFEQIDIVARLAHISQGSINNIINSRVQLTKVDAHLQTANLLSELLNIRDGRDLLLANLSGGELYDIICFMCTSYFLMSFYVFC